MTKGIFYPIAAVVATVGRCSVTLQCGHVHEENRRSSGELPLPGEHAFCPTCTLADGETNKPAWAAGVRPFHDYHQQARVQFVDAAGRSFIEVTPKEVLGG